MRADRAGSFGGGAVDCILQYDGENVKPFAFLWPPRPRWLESRRNPSNPSREEICKMREAVIVSYARTGLAKAGRGGFNITPSVSQAAHAIKHAVAKSGVEPADVEDCFMGNVSHGAPGVGRTMRD